MRGDSANYNVPLIYFKSFRSIEMALMHRHFKMSAWKSGMFLSVRFINFNNLNELYLTLSAVDMLTFDTAYNASTLPRYLKVSWFIV
jgi:hypothetical protein